MTTKIDSPRKGYALLSFGGIVGVTESHYDNLNNLWVVVRDSDSPVWRKGEFINCGNPANTSCRFYPCADWRKGHTVLNGQPYKQVLRRKS